MKITEFKIDQKVKMRDEDDGSIAYGIVKNVITDSERPFVSIQWDDLSTPANHYEEEFHLIKPRIN